MTRTTPCLRCMVLIASASATVLAASAPPDDCEVSPCYWHFGDQDNNFQINGLDELTALAGVGVQFAPIQQGDPTECPRPESAGPIDLDSEPSSPESACDDRFYYGLFFFEEEETCERSRQGNFGSAHAKSYGTYRLWSHARPYSIAINFDGASKSDAVFAAYGGITSSGATAYSGIAGGAGNDALDEDSCISVVMPFVIEPTTLPVQVKIHATWLGSLSEEGADLCEYELNGQTHHLGSWEHTSALWGGIGVWHPASETWVPGLDKYVYRDLDPTTGESGIGTRAVVLGPDNPLFSELTDDPVDIANLRGYGPGEYELVYWVHSSNYLRTGATSSTDRPCSDVQSSTEAHIFQGWLDLKDVSFRGDFNNDGRVDVRDFSIFLVQFGAGVDGNDVAGASRPYQADLNRDGKVDVADFSIFLVEFGAEVDCSTPRFRRF